MDAVVLSKEGRVVVGVTFDQADYTLTDGSYCPTCGAPLDDEVAWVYPITYRGEGAVGLECVGCGHVHLVRDATGARIATSKMLWLGVRIGDKLVPVGVRDVRRGDM